MANQILIEDLSEQLAIEEDFCAEIEQQILDLNEDSFSDAKKLLERIKDVLDLHFISLTQALDKLEGKLKNGQLESEILDEDGVIRIPSREYAKKRISKILRDNYSKLNLITMGNTLIHTAALALEEEDIASTALSHLKNLAPLVVELGKLTPVVVARELENDTYDILPEAGKIALENVKRAWKV